MLLEKGSRGDQQHIYLASLCRKQTQELKALHGPMQALHSSMQRVGSAGSRARKWQRPSSGSLKINVDGSFRVADENDGDTYVIRDDEGRAIQSGFGRQRFACNPMRMELRACVEGLKAVADLGCGDIILETDAMQVVHAGWKRPQ